MTVIARRVRATPFRTAGDAWAFISDLIADSHPTARPYLKAAGNAGAMVISEEHTQHNPIRLSGCGPQVRFYTLHGFRAIDGESMSEQSLIITPSDAWELALPAAGPDFDLVSSALNGIPHLCTYDPAEDRGGARTTPEESLSGQVRVDLTALERSR